MPVGSVLMAPGRERRWFLDVEAAAGTRRPGGRCPARLSAFATHHRARASGSQPPNGLAFRVCSQPTLVLRPLHFSPLSFPFSILSLSLSLKTTAATIVGLGNVALDCARLLLRSPGALATTDAAPAAQKALSTSAVKTVHLLARRGPAAAACTAAELREALGLPGVGVWVWPSPLPPPSPEEEASLAARGRGAKRVAGLLADAAARAGTTADGGPAARELHLHFYTAPAAYLPGAGGDASAVGAVAVRRTTPEGKPEEGAAPPPPPLPSTLVLEAVGFRTLPLDGVPWDPATATVPSGPGGRVAEMESDGHAPSSPSLAPLYVSGWARRGPSGIIGSNAADGTDVAVAIVADAEAGRVRPVAGGGLESLMGKARPLSRVVTAAGWRAIDAAERAAGAAAPTSPPRVKLTEAAAMVGVAEGVEGGVWGG